MKRIKLNTNVGWWGKAGQTYDVSDQRAIELLRNGVKKDEHDRYHIVSRAELIEDLGRHIGRSKRTYDTNGPSKAFGPPGKDKPDAMIKIQEHNMAILRMVTQMNDGIKIYECKLCGYKNNPDLYAMTQFGKRYYHDFCIDKATWHTMKLITSGQHDKVQILKMFKEKIK